MRHAEVYIKKLSVTNPLREPALRSAIQALHLPVGSRGLDAGCGIGFQAKLLAEAVGATGRITGLDLSPEMIRYAQSDIENSGLAERIAFQRGDVRQLPFEDNMFDWAWSADCVGYAPLEPLPLIRELVRVVKPGGIVAILAWSSQQLLPGHPLLEARLNATCSGIAPFVHGKNPDSHFSRALGWFRAAGLDAVKARTFAGSVQAPLSQAIRDALIALLAMRWVDVEPELTSELGAEYQRLCNPDSPGFILDLSDYYTFFTYSMFSGVVAEGDLD
ncbi:class I SAM-dependent methyltransferase [candidate division KSB1 bacterium]|nr:class I SAM-dependent methyltransferase [candidate division KSB1 bacterium]